MTVPKKKVLVISSNFSPETSGIAIYSTDLVFDILNPNYDVTVITGLPHYPWWKIPEQFSHLVPGKSHIDGMELIRIKHAIPHKSGALGRAKLEFSIWLNGRNAIRNLESINFDLIIAIMPTVASGLLARHIAKKTRTPGIVIFQDVTSLGALQSGMPGASLFYRVAKHLESRATRWASKIIVVSEDMARVVSELIHTTVPIEVIHNYSLVDSSQMSQLEAKKLLGFPREEYLLLHTGNIGHKQDLLNVVSAAKLLENYNDIKFLIIGHGNQENIIKETVKNCNNIEVRPFVSVNEYPTLLASANALLVNERTSLREMSLPSKLTSYLNSERPVIAAVSNQSATRKFLKESALLVEPGNPSELAAAILRLKLDSLLQEDFARRGKDFSDSNLSKSAGREKYLKIVKEVFKTARN